MNKMFHVAWFATFASTLLTGTASAQCELEQFSNPTALSQFGFGDTVTLSSERAVVSSLFNNERSYQVFARAGTDWFPTELLTPRVGTNFNQAMDMDKDTVACGLGNDGTYGEVDPHAPAPSGEVDIFDLRTPGGFVSQSLIPSDAEAGQRFGTSISIDGNMMAIGAPGDSEKDTSAGAVYIFEYVDGSWTEMAKIRQATPQAFGNFGSEVELNDGHLLVKGGFLSIVLGAPVPLTNSDASIFAPFDASSSVFVFEKRAGEWLQTGALENSEQRLSRFGHSMAVSNGTIFLGALVGGTNFPIFSPITTLPPIPGPQSPSYGVVLVFEKGGDSWVNTSVLRPNDEPDADFFGASLDLHGDFAVIGSPLTWATDGTEQGAGGAYTFARTENGWRQSKFLHSDVEGSLNGSLGSSVAIVDGMAIVGAPQAMVAGAYPGLAFAYGVGADCSGNGRPDTCDIADGTLNDTDGDLIPDICETGEIVRFCDGSMNSGGLVSELNAVGVASLTTKRFAFTVEGATPDQFGVILAGNGTTRMPLGAGMRCVGGFQSAQFFATSDSTGSVLRPLDMSSPLMGLVPYSTWNFQYAYRDGGEVQVTNAISVTFMP